MQNYSGLRPGLHLKYGGQTKSLELLGSEIFKLGGAAISNVDALAAQVAWVYIALSLRKERILEVPMYWQKDGEDIAAPPVAFKMRGLLPRIDEALQLYSRAYLFKLRNANGKFLGVRWVDPLTIEPNDSSFSGPEQVEFYTRRIAGHPDMNIPAANIIDLTVRGQREFVPAPAAAQATSLAAQIIHGMQTVQDTAFDNNAIPPVLINVPRATSEEDKERLQGFWARLFNRGKGTPGQRVVAVREDVTVQQVELDFGKLLMTDIEESQVLAILKSHGVPDALGRADASANRETSNEATRNFISTLGARAEFLAEEINADEDMMALGLTLDFRVAEHRSQRRDEAAAAGAFNTYLGGLHPAAAGHLVGIRVEDFPEDMQGEIFLDIATTAEMSPGDGSPDDGPKSAFLIDLEKYRRKAMKRIAAGKTAGVGFTSEAISDSLIAAIEQQLENTISVGRVQMVFDDAARWEDYG